MQKPFLSVNRVKARDCRLAAKRSALRGCFGMSFSRRQGHGGTRWKPIVECVGAVADVLITGFWSFILLLGGAGRHGWK